MIPFKFDFQPSSALFGLGLFIIWLVWLAIYWRALLQILSAPGFDTQLKILWFLVITLVPVIGIITYWMLVPDEVVKADVFRASQPRPRPSPPSSEKS